MAEISMKGLLMDKGARSVDGWLNSLHNQMIATEVTARNVASEWRRLYRPSCNHLTLVYNAQIQSDFMSDLYPDLKKGVLRWRLLHGATEAGFDSNNFFTFSNVSLSRSDAKPKERAHLFSLIEMESPGLIDIMREYEAVRLRIKTEVEHFHSIYRSLSVMKMECAELSMTGDIHSKSRKILTRCADSNYEI